MGAKCVVFCYFSRKISSSLTTLVSQRKGSTPRRGSTAVRFGFMQNAIEGAGANAAVSGAVSLASAFAHKALVIRKSRNEHAEEVFERSKQMLEKHNISTIDCRLDSICDYFE